MLSYFHGLHKTFNKSNIRDVKCTNGRLQPWLSIDGDNRAVNEGSSANIVGTRPLDRQQAGSNAR